MTTAFTRATPAIAGLPAPARTPRSSGDTSGPDGFPTISDKQWWLPRPVERICRLVCPVGANRWQFAWRAGIGAMLLTPPFFFGIGASAVKSGHLSAALWVSWALGGLGVATVAWITRWWGHDRLLGTDVKVLTTQEAHDLIAEFLGLPAGGRSGG